MDDLTDGALDGWPVSLLIERDAGGTAFGAQCAAYTGDDDAEPPQDIRDKCEAISRACDNLKPAAAMRKAKSMGFVPDSED